MFMEKVGAFYNNKIFEIPVMQRPYSWGIEQVKALLTDLNLAIRRDESHYCGPIFLERSKGEDGKEKEDTKTGVPDNLKHFDVLDGQQRITSLMLIASAIANDEKIIEAASNGNSRAINTRFRLQNLYSYIGEPDGEHDTSRLIFNDPDMDLMMNHLLFGNPEQIDEDRIVKTSMRRLKENYQFVIDNIDLICSNEERNSATKILVGNKFLESLKIETVEMKGHGFNKYTVFEAINNRGLNLSQFDMIKNLCLHIADQHEKRCESTEPQVAPKITIQVVRENWHKTLSHLFEY